MSNKLQIEHVEVCLYRNDEQTFTGFWVFDDISHFPVTEFTSREAVPGDLPSIMAYCREEGFIEALDMMRQHAEAGRGLHFNGQPIANAVLREALGVKPLQDVAA
jgi:hypothetical protein